jgi:hypothetical protein
MMPPLGGGSGVRGIPSELRVVEPVPRRESAEEANTDWA